MGEFFQVHVVLGEITFIRSFKEINVDDLVTHQSGVSVGWNLSDLLHYHGDSDNDSQRGV